MSRSSRCPLFELSQHVAHLCQAGAQCAAQMKLLFQATLMQEQDAVGTEHAAIDGDAPMTVTPAE